MPLKPTTRNCPQKHVTMFTFLHGHFKHVYVLTRTGHRLLDIDTEYAWTCVKLVRIVNMKV